MNALQRLIWVPVAMVSLIVTAQEKPEEVQPAELSSIKFESFDKAILQSREQQKPIVLVFSAKWCSWCRKLEAGPMRSPEVLAVAPNYVWAKSDLDAEPFLAAVFQVRSVPAIRIVNGKGETLEGSSGYMTAYQLKALLEKHKDGFNAVGVGEANILQSTDLRDRLVAYKHGETDRAVLSEAVMWLSKPQPPMKRAITEAFLNHKENAWSTLLTNMASEKLAVRAAAVELLKQSSQLKFSFDPFANLEQRESQLATVQKQVNTLLAKEFYPDMR